jgi:hypothetical protein
MEGRRIIMNMNPQLLEVVKRDHDYAIFYHGQPLITPKGKELSYADSRILEHIARELSIDNFIDASLISSYSIFSYQKDNIDAEIEKEVIFVQESLKDDPLVQRITNNSPLKDKTADPLLLDYMDNLNKALPFVFSGVSEVVNCLNEYLMKEGLGSLIILKNSYNDFQRFIQERYKELSPEKKSAIRMLNHVHKSGILLPFLLVLNKISASEYTNTMYIVHLPDIPKNNPDGSDENKNESEECFTFDWKNPIINFINIHNEVLKIAEYLSYFSPKKQASSGVLELIKAGESYSLEFKSTLRWNIKAAKKDPAIEHASLKTISAFLNSGGGTLLIGVEDSGAILGLESDAFPNEDRFSLHFWDLVKSSIGEEFSAFILTSFEKIEDKNVFTVKCSKSPKPVFLNQKGFNEEFYIRTGPSSTSLSIQDSLKYIEYRFKQ